MVNGFCLRSLSSRDCWHTGRGCLLFLLLLLRGFSFKVVSGFSPLTTPPYSAIISPRNQYKKTLKLDYQFVRPTYSTSFTTSSRNFLTTTWSTKVDVSESKNSAAQKTPFSSKKLNEYTVQFSAVADQGLLKFQELFEIEEIRSLLEEGDLEKEEVQEIWASSPKVNIDESEVTIKDTTEKINLEGFLYIMEAIDDLFEEEELETQTGTKDNERAQESTNKFSFSTFTPDQLDKFFSLGKSSKEISLTKTKSTLIDVITLNSFMAIKEINEFLADGLIARGELFALWSEAVGVGEKEATKEQYMELMKAIDDLFEVEELDEENEEDFDEELGQEEEEDEINNDSKNELDNMELEADTQSDVSEMKNYIIRLLGTSQGVGIQDDKELDKVVLSIVPQLLLSSDNYLARACENLREENPQMNLSEEVLDKVERSLVGKWDLLYTTSTNFRHAKGLSGLASTIPGGTLHSFSETFSRIENSVANVEMSIHREEQIKVEGLFGMFRGGNTDDKNIVVSIDGYYEVKDSRDIITKLPTITLDVEPQRIDCDALKVGTKMEGGWRSVRTLNRMEILYVDKDLRVMRAGGRGSYFIFKRGD